MGQNLGLKEGELAYDLRAYYANIVGQHLIDVAIARKEGKLGDYFKTLEDLYVVVKHKIKNKKKEVDHYPELMRKALEIIKKNEDVFTGNSSDAEGYYAILKALRRIETYLYRQMDEAKMFGGARETEGLF